MDLSAVVTNPDFAESFTVTRYSGGKFVAGGFNQSATQLAFYGVVSIAKPKDLDAVPEADRVTEHIVVHSTQQFMVTNQAATSDLITWQGAAYRVTSVSNYSSRGYWKAIAIRTSGT